MNYPPQVQDSRLSTDPENADSFVPPRKTLLNRFTQWIPYDSPWNAIRLPESDYYSRLASTDAETDANSAPPKTFLDRLRQWKRTCIIAGTTLFLLLVVLALHKPRKILPPLSSFPEGAFEFDKDPRPSWLDKYPPAGPLILRVAVVSHTSEFDRRQALRETAFLGVPESDVKIDFRFFVGAPVGNRTSRWKTNIRLASERIMYGDVVQLWDIDDIKPRLSEKRYAALKWGGSAPHDSYDYFMTIDSDTFVRFGALARRMPLFLEGKHVNPREDRFLIGRMASHLVYFMNTVPDGNPDPHDEDEYIRGPWYNYPAGIGYMLSSALVDTLLSTDPPLAHHVHYPSDDVMIGSWLAAVELFPNKDIVFESAESSPELRHRVVPPPYLPEPIHTELFDDTVGWHDFKGRGGHDGSFTWNSVCVHHISGDEMRAFRAMDDIKGEWDP